MALRIKDWHVLYENNRTRNLRNMRWVPVPNRFDGDGYTTLVDHPDGASHLGAWLAILEVASRCEPRGLLLRQGGEPYEAQSLARISRLPVTVFDGAIPRLLAIGWLEDASQDGVTVRRVDAKIPHVSAGIPQGATETPQDGAGIPQATDYGMEWKEGREGMERKEPRPPAVTFNSWEEFQNTYPEPKRFVKVEAGCRAYVGRIDGKPGEHARLMDGLRRHLDCDQWRRSLEQDGGRFIPTMETFIVNGAYSDRPPAYRPPATETSEERIARMVLSE